APDGVTVKEVVFPTPIDLKQEGADQPLAVFERDFVVGVQLAIAPTVSTGAVKVPLRLRYQACNDTTCYAPANAATELTLDVVAPGTATSPANRDVIDRIAFGRGNSAGIVAPPNSSNSQNPTNPSNLPNPSNLSHLDRFAQAGETFGGYMGADAFLKKLRDAESGVKERGMFEGRGPLAILLLVFLGGLALNLTPCVLPMI